MSLQDEIAADLDTFMDVGGFAVVASYVHQGGAAVNINVIFDAPFLESELAAAVGIAAVRPSCFAKTSDVANARNGDTITIGGKVYTIVSVQPDGTGLTQIIFRV